MLIQHDVKNQIRSYSQARRLQTILIASFSKNKNIFLILYYSYPTSSNIFKIIISHNKFSFSNNISFFFIHITNLYPTITIHSSTFAFYAYAF
ncbi:hypothetical protein Leryth_022557 [Lithospermum erythrorhizon]|nr:hypothetical protein Leryth_022557 [Lithospermum erythrorhizon]